MAIYVGNDMFVEVYNHEPYIRPRVKVYINDFTIPEHDNGWCNPIVGRLKNATEEQRNQAADWAFNRLANKNINPITYTKLLPVTRALAIQGNKYNCSSFVWDAYFKSGLDIGPTNNFAVKSAGLTPYLILNEGLKNGSIEIVAA